MKASKTAVITGATSGIGTVVAKHLAKTEYNLVVLARSEQKMETLSNTLITINPNISVEGIICDFSSLESTANACKAIQDKLDRIDLLLLNAGLWNSKSKQSQDGIEETFHVNLISQIQVFKALETLIPRNNQSKVIITSSGLHQGEIHFDDLEFRNQFSGFKSYRQSKLGLMMLTRWLARQDEYKGISFYSVHPGMVNTNLGRDAGWFSRVIFKLLGKPPEKGAQTHINVVDADNSTLTNGEYYADKKVAKTTEYSYDLDAAGKLWDSVDSYLTKSNS